MTRSTTAALCVILLAASCGPKSSLGDAAIPDVASQEVGDARVFDAGDAEMTRGGDKDAEADRGSPVECRFPEAAPAAGITVEFSFDDPPTLPYPFDLFTQPLAGSPTGLTLALGKSNTLLIDEGIDSIFEEQFVLDQLNRLSGFSEFAPVLFALSGAPDLPPQEDGPLPADWSAAIVLFELLPGGGCGKPLPVVAVADPFELGGKNVHLLRVWPFLPLTPGHTYAVLLTRGLGPGATAIPHPHFRHLVGCGGQAPDADPDQVARAGDLLQPALACAQAADPRLCPCDLAAGTVFTTAASDHLLKTIYSYLHAPAAPPLNLTLDGNGDGEPDLYPPAALPGVPPEVEDYSSMALALRGEFDTPDLRGEDKDIHLVNGLPVPSATLRVPFVVMFPAAPAVQPFKVVVLGHGHSGCKERIAYLASRFGEKGLALAGIDAIGHGDLKGTGMFMTFDIAEVHGSFVQTQAGLLRFFQALQQLQDLDVYPGGVGDGVPDLDLSGLGYIGESLGSLAGGVACSVEPTVASVVLNVGGGGLANFAHNFLSWPVLTATGPALIELKVVLQSMVEEFDPIGFAAALSAGAAPGATPRLVMMQNVVGDSAMDGPPTEDLSRALGLTYVCPCPIPVPLLPMTFAPAKVQGLFVYDNAAHGFLLGDHSNPAASDAVRHQAAVFFQSALVSGVPLVIDPFAERGR